MSKNQLPDGWKKCHIEDIASINSGIGFPKTHQGNTDGEIPFYKVSDISQSVLNQRGLLTTANNYISQQELIKLKGCLFPKGSTLFAKIGEAVKLNRRALLQASGLADNNVMGVKAVQNEMDNFIYFLLKTIDLGKFSRSTTVPSIRKDDIGKLLFDLPPLAEQKIIADLLDQLTAQADKINAHLETILEKLKLFRQSVLNTAVAGKVSDSGTNTNRDTILNQWKTTNIGSIAFVGTGKTPSRTEPSYWIHGDVPWLTSSVTNNNLISSAEHFLTRDTIKKCGLKLYPKGTLILAMYGEGKTRGQVAELGIEATCNQACAAIIVDKKNALGSFIKIILKENYEKIRKEAQGGNQPNLNLEKVKSISILLPPLEEQTEIVRRVGELFTFADSIEQQVKAAQERAKNLTQSILAKAFRGELTAKWREEHPELISGENSAEALLKKIKAAQAALSPAKKGRAKKNTQQESLL